MALYQETLATYRTRFLREVRDASQQYFNNQGSATPFADIDAWIAEAMRWRDLWSKGARSYRPAVPLQTSIDQYDLTTLFPNDTVLDIATLWLIWGTYRVQLDERPFSEVTNAWRPWTNYVNVPGAYCRYGAAQVFIATAGAMPYTVDWDVVVLAAALVNPADKDPLPYPYTEPVPKYAAYLGKQNQRQFEEAEMFKNEARIALADIEGSRVGELPLQSHTPRGTRR